VGNELGLEVLGGFDYFWMRREDWVDLGRFGGVFYADAGVGD